MSTKQQTGVNRMPMGADIDPDFNVPECTIEDVDRAVFNLFEKDINLLDSKWVIFQDYFAH